MTRVVSASRIATLLGDFDRSPAYRGLAEGLRVLITDGRVPVGVRLPSERELTDALAVSRTTVTRAYAELRDHGFLVSRQGSGSVASLPASRGHRGDHLLPPGDLPEDKIDLTCAAPVPGPGVLAAYERAVADLPAYLGGTGYYPSGLPDPARGRRRVVRRPRAAHQPRPDHGRAGRAGRCRDRRACPARAPGDRAVTESPTYPNAIATLTHSGARVVGVDVPRNDADTRGADHHAAAGGAPGRLPDPGLPQPDRRADGRRGTSRRGRRAVHGPARRRSSTSRWSRWRSTDRRCRRRSRAYLPDAVSVGSLSKPFWGGLRIGWIRVPADRMDAFFQARLSLDLGAPLLEQLVATDLLSDGRRPARAPSRPAARLPRRRPGRGRRAPPRLAGRAARPAA